MYNLLSFYTPCYRWPGQEVFVAIFARAIILNVISNYYEISTTQRSLCRQK